MHHLRFRQQDYQQTSANNFGVKLKVKMNVFQNSILQPREQNVMREK